MKKENIGVKTGVAFAMAAAMLIAHTSGVFAGGSGQQLSMHDVNGNAYSVHIAGYNQSGSWVDQYINMPSTYLDDPGYWWKTFNNANVTIYSFSGPNGTGSVLSNSSYYVPPSQSSDWYTCQVDGGSACASGFHTA